MKSFSFSVAAPKMGTITIKNENLVATFLSTPRSKAVEMVAPDLEIPGKTAIAWAMPMTKARKVFIFLSPEPINDSNTTKTP